MLVNKEILLVLNVILNSQTTDNKKDRYIHTYFYILLNGDETTTKNEREQKIHSTGKQKALILVTLLFVCIMIP